MSTTTRPATFADLPWYCSDETRQLITSLWWEGERVVVALSDGLEIAYSQDIDLDRLATVFEALAADAAAKKAREQGEPGRRAA